MHAMSWETTLQSWAYAALDSRKATGTGEQRAVGSVH